MGGVCLDGRGVSQLAGCVLMGGGVSICEVCNLCFSVCYELLSLLNLVL